MAFTIVESLEVHYRCYDPHSVTLARTHKVLALLERRKGVAERYKLAYFTPNSQVTAQMV